MGARASYAEAAIGLGKYLAEQNIGLVYGGASIGLMGAVADAARTHGGRVIGVIPQSIADMEIAHQGLSELHVVESMHQRKALMADLASGFIALPGGIGTLEETFEALTWSQLGIHAKPVGLLNIDGFYDGLDQFLDTLVEQAFVKPEHRAFLQMETQPEHLVDSLLQTKINTIPKVVEP